MDQANPPGHSHVLDIGIASLTEQLESDMNTWSSLTSTMQLGGGSRPLIIRRDANLTFTRNVDEFEYDPHPRYVSIGPYNWSRCDSSSLARKADKIGCLTAVLRESSARSVRVQVLQDILCELERLEGRARSWYGDDFQYMTTTEFVRMLLLDGCYILVRFGCVNANSVVQEGDDTAPPVATGGDTNRLEDVDVANGVVQEGDDTAPLVAAAGGDIDRLENIDVANGVMQEGDNTVPPVATAGGNTDKLEDVNVANGVVQVGDDTAPPVAAAGGDTDRLEDVNVANGVAQEEDDIAPPVVAAGGDTDRLEDADVANGVVQEGDDTAPPVAAAGGDTDRLEDIDVVRDVFYLVENQIPYFVIETILSKTGGNDSAESNIAAYVRRLLKGHQYAAAPPEDVALTESGHLLHLLHLHLKPTTGGAGATDPSVGRWRTATEYDFAGIKLKKRAVSTEEARCILDVDRRGGTLHVPCLNIDEETWRILRNLTALEQHNPVVGSYVTAYCTFMSQVACNAQDVELLSMEGIIVHQMGNHGEVADHFANLCKGVVFDANDPTYNYLRETCQALEKRFRSRRGRWMAWLRRKYFRPPWLVVGLVAAAIGLACAVVQAVYSVLSYKLQRRTK